MASQRGKRLKWKKPGLALSGFLLFVFALRLMKEGVGGLTVPTGHQAGVGPNV